MNMCCKSASMPLQDTNVAVMRAWCSAELQVSALHFGFASGCGAHALGQRVVRRAVPRLRLAPLAVARAASQIRRRVRRNAWRCPEVNVHSGSTADTQDK